MHTDLSSPQPPASQAASTSSTTPTWTRLVMAAAAALMLLIAACSSNDDAGDTAAEAPSELALDSDSGDAAETAATDDTDTGGTSDGAAAADDDGEPDSEGLQLVIPTPTATPTVTATPSPTVVPLSDPTCMHSAAGGASYSVTYPLGWHTDLTDFPCRLFSPAPINLPTEVEYSMEIHLYVDERPWQQVINEVTADASDYWNGPTTTPTSVDGQTALVLEGTTGSGYFVETPYRVYLVDLGNAVLRATAREYTDGSGAAAPDFAANVATLDFMMTNINLTPGLAPTCTEDLATGALVVSDVHDLDGDGTMDTVEVNEDPTTANQAVVTAYLSNGEVLQGVTYYEAFSPVYELRMGDLDGDGWAEVVPTLSSNASGGNSALLTMSGCQLVAPAADATHGEPGLNNHFSVGSPFTWGCTTLTGGTTGIRNLWGSSLADGTWEASYSTWALIGSDWQRVDQNTMTGLSQPFHPTPPAPVPCPWDPPMPAMCPVTGTTGTVIAEELAVYDFDFDGTPDNVQILDDGAGGAYIQTVLSNGGVMEGFIAGATSSPLGFGGFAMGNIDSSSVAPEAIVVIDIGQATTSDVLLPFGCDWTTGTADPTDGLPTLAVRGAAGYSVNWGCTAAPTGGIIIGTLYVDHNAGNAYTYGSWELVGGVWNLLTTTTELDDPTVPTPGVCPWV